MLNRFYLNDKEFLRELDLYNQKEKYARVVSLNQEEEPIEEIQGKIISGTINVDGSSSVRRTCNLTLVTQDININDYYWGLNTKFVLEIGVKNEINPKYPDIIWFNQGMYLISSFSESLQTSSYTISISGKDKMCLLNGEVGGHITALSWDFGTIEETKADGTIEKVDVKLEDAIRDAVHEFAKEPLGNIVVDLDASGYNLLEYKGTENIYLLCNADDTDDFKEFNIGGEDLIYFNSKVIKYNELEEYGGKYYEAIDSSVTDLAIIDCSKIKKINDVYKEVDFSEILYEKNKFYYFENDEYILDEGESQTYINQIYYEKTWEVDNNNEYIVWRVKPNTPIGYEETDLVYAHSDSNGLTMAVGETITNMLDKIVNQLGDYEYFYDLDGKFRFQRKKTYINSSFNNITKTVDGEVIIEDNAQSSSFTYYFGGNALISSFQNSPNILNLKNDYSIWGKRASSSGAELPIHIRYAIDKKPSRYITLDGRKYSTFKEEGFTEVDWREIIYQMAVDYRSSYYTDPTYCEKIQLRNGKDENGDWYFPKGRTGYEQYYTDIISFWRQLYCPKGEYYPLESGVSKKDFNYCTYVSLNENTYKRSTYYYYKDGELCWSGALPFDEEKQYYKVDNRLFTLMPADTLYEPNKYYRKIHNNYFMKDKSPTKIDYSGSASDELYSLSSNHFLRIKGEDTGYFKYIPAIAYNQALTYYDYFEEENEIYGDDNWAKQIRETPETLNFWFDFLDTGAEMDKYGVSVIGDRTKALNDSDVKAIYFREIPKIVFYSDEDGKENLNKDYSGSGYHYIEKSDFLENMLQLSSRGKSAMDALTTNFYNYSYCVETVSITSVPVYYLEPNTRIFINDPETGINGEYLVNSFSISLEYDKTMSISATKAPKKLF